MEKIADNLKGLCNLDQFKERKFYYAHKDGRIGFLEDNKIHWYIYDAEVAGFVDKGVTDHPQMAKLTKTP
jgi:hypothetical protein